MVEKIERLFFNVVNGETHEHVLLTRGNAQQQYGERETASRAARPVLRSFIDWGVLNETNDKGLYTQGDPYSIQAPRLITWLVETSLHARMNGSAAIKDLLDSPNIFPIRLPHPSADHWTTFSPRLDLEKMARQPGREVPNDHDAGRTVYIGNAVPGGHGAIKVATGEDTNRRR